MDETVVVNDDGTVTHRIEGWFHDGVTKYTLEEAMNRWPAYAQQLSAAFFQLNEKPARKPFPARRERPHRRFGLLI